MSKTEEFLKKWFPTIKIKDKHDREMPLISWESCEEIMEAFLKQEVNAIIENNKKRYNKNKEKADYWHYTELVKDLKLLKNESKGMSIVLSRKQ